MFTQTKPAHALDVLTRDAADFAIGSVGSPSNTTEIVIDILQVCESSKVLGQLVYLVVPQDGKQMAVIGQISRVETKNRWHEDLTFRGIIKRRGHLPHLSSRADVRTATISVQACFAVQSGGGEGITESILGISPSTGLTIYRVRDEVLEVLLSKYADQLLYLGHVYGTDVKMPFWLKHFGDEEGGAGEAYHIGVFGRSGSGKSGLAAYMLLGYARHSNMGMIFIDPQSQFSSGVGLPFNLFGSLSLLGREVQTYRLVSRVRFRADNVKLFCRILAKTNFYRSIGVAAAENQEYAAQELRGILLKVLKDHNSQLDNPPGKLLQQCLQALLNDALALQRIYPSKDPRTRLQDTLTRILSDQDEQQRLVHESWQPALDLFMKTDSQGNLRTSLNEIIGSVIGAKPGQKRPIVFLDISAEGTTFEKKEELVALFLREISRSLESQGKQAFTANNSLNCLIVVDEAHSYARYRPSSDTTELAALTQSFITAVRTTRKYGLGYMFITQTLASLHPEIIQQLRLNAFGYGLTMGGEYAKLEELVGDKQALSLYHSFVDPQASKQFPFMFTGPASPLSFTGAPLFAQIFTSFEDFVNANSWVSTTRRTSADRPLTPPRRQVEL